MCARTLPSPRYTARRLSVFASYCKGVLGNVNVEVLIELARTVDFVSTQTRGKPVFFSLYKPAGDGRYMPVTAVNYVSALRDGLIRDFAFDRVFSQDEWSVIQTVVNGSVYKSRKVRHA